MNATQYQLYLRGIHWKQFRKHILRTRGNACEECGISNVWSLMSYGFPLHVHHVTYDRLGQERDEDVRVLCKRCHDGQHGTTNLPDMGGVFWKICRAIKEAPDSTYNWLKTLDQLPLRESGQLPLAFAGDS